MANSLVKKAMAKTRSPKKLGSMFNTHVKRNKFTGTLNMFATQRPKY